MPSFDTRFQCCRVTFYDIKLIPNVAYFGKISTALSYDKSGVARLNLTVTQLIDYTKGRVAVIMRSKSSDKVKDFDKVLFRTTMDTCLLTSQPMTNFITRIISENLQKGSNITLQCPQPKGIYQLENFAIDVDPYIPSFITKFIPPGVTRY